MFDKKWKIERQKKAIVWRVGIPEWRRKGRCINRIGEDIICIWFDTADEIWTNFRRRYGRSRNDSDGQKHKRNSYNLKKKTMSKDEELGIFVLLLKNEKLYNCKYVQSLVEKSYERTLEKILRIYLENTLDETSLGFRPAKAFSRMVKNTYGENQC